MSPKDIKGIRETLSLTQQELADMIGAQQHTVARWEKAHNKPTGAYLKALIGLQEEANRKRKN